ncbi:hypothetical protein SAMN05421736_101102 [Evansella caseinilytica]|uniref:Uncharacterized protein n=1 Tax=Evansella caseinilytica TaxID=1503961 RepID=A0A1H3GBC1_9BACI|nr:hypothetical protein SAMN05421736_101102 [Evansella caseinilytica]
MKTGQGNEFDYSLNIRHLLHEYFYRDMEKLIHGQGNGFGYERNMAPYCYSFFFILLSKGEVKLTSKQINNCHHILR